MNHSEWDFHRAEKGDDDLALPETPEDRADRFGLRTAFLVLCIAFHRGDLGSEPAKF